MREVVINRFYGGFALSDEAHQLYEVYASAPSTFEIKRDSEHLVRVVRELGNKASGDRSDLKVVQIPDDIEWTVEEYDGVEWVAEKHRTWS
jgi:hypothetical protein